MQALSGVSNKLDVSSQSYKPADKAQFNMQWQYCYSGLPSGSIRLLKLSPGRGSKPLHGFLIATPLKGALNPQLKQDLELSAPEDEDNDNSSIESWAISEGGPNTSNEESDTSDDESDTSDNESDISDQESNISSGESDIPQYSAISYCWGAPVCDHRIGLDDSYLDITESAAGALRRFRKREKSHLVWIDTICINQYDKIEKVAHVSMMGDIYREADKVLVWLGEADPTDCYAFWSIAMVGESGSSKDGLPEDHGPYLDDGMNDLMN